MISVYLLLFKISQYIFGISVSFLAALSSFAICREKVLGAAFLKFVTNPDQAH